MKKLVVLKLDGQLGEGVRVSLEIGKDGLPPFVELSDNQLRLPPIPTLPEIYQRWCRSYRSLDGHRIKPKQEQISNVRFKSLKDECEQLADTIKQNFLSWLQADSFRLIKEQCLIHLSPDDEVRFIIRTTDNQLRKLPWHLWDLFEHYPYAEIGFSCNTAQRFTKKYRPHVRILIILGNSDGINVANDEKLLKQYCKNAELVVLVEPSPSELNEYLWDEKGWDILFFSGHSRTEESQGRIFLNRSDSLTMQDLREGLKTAVRQGLQLAFFNSCDGLGIASELENLYIPQVIVMREPVPDKVANQFLKYLFQEFTGGKSLYQSVNIARKKLQGFEKDYPCASWLPVIVQNLLETPPTWQSLGAIANCPYRGLAAFQEEDAPYFFGREAVTYQLVNAVKQKPLIAVVGASGSGKSSVVFAGLIPQLKQDRNRDWQIVSFRPGNNPFESLAIAFSSILAKVNPSGNDLTTETEVFNLSNSLIETEDREVGLEDCHQQKLTELELEIDLKASNLALFNTIEKIIKDAPKTHLVLIADQFEELYTLYHYTEERQTFLDNLLNAVDKAPNFTLILTLRADFYGEALSYRRLADALQDVHINLGAMNAQELEAVITQPAAIYNVQLEEGLTQRLVDAVLQSPNHLPLLEFTLTQLWQKQYQGYLTHQAYTEIGGVETALANHAEEIYAQLNTTDKDRVQKIFIQLVQPGEASTDIRRLAIRGEVKDENWDLVTRLADARLVVTNFNQITGIETVEIIHEALIKNWRRFGQWMRIDGDFRRWQEQLRVIIKQWENSDNDIGGLLRGKPLIDAEDWLLKRSHQISDDEQGFINLSLELQEKEEEVKSAARKRTFIWLTGGLVTALLLAGIALFQWRQAEYQREQAQINELKTLSISAKVLIKSGNDIEGLTSILKNSQSLDKLDTLDTKTKIGLLTSLLESLNQIREYNKLEGLEGHKGTVTSVKHSPNGQLLASASQDGKIKIWQRDGKFVQTLTGHKQGVFSVTFSSDGKFLIAASFDNTITFWRYNSQSNLFEKSPLLTVTDTETDTKIIRSFALSPNNQILATGYQNGQVKLQTLKGEKLQKNQQEIQAHNAKIWSLNFSPDGKTFATASADKTVKLWNLDGKVLKTLKSHEDEVLSVVFSPDGKSLASGSKDNTISLNNLGQLYELKGHTNEVLDVRFSGDGKLLASAGADDTVIVWSTQGESKQKIYTFKGHGGKASEVSFSPDGQTLATASADKAVKLWRFDGILPSFEGNSVSVSPDSKIIATGNKQGVITLGQKDGSLIRSFKAHETEIIKVHFSPDGKVIVSIGKDNQIKLWNLEGKLLKSWQGHEDNNSSGVFEPIRDISFSPDGKILVSIGEIDVKLWDLSGNVLHNWQVDNQFMTSINFSPDGKTVIAAVDNTVKIWNLNGKLLSTLSGHTENIASVSLSPDGKMIATAGNDQTVKLWDMSGKLLINIPHSNNVYSVGFSPDSQMLISASGSNINFWGLDGKLINSLQAGESSIKDVSFSPDGKMFTSVDMKKNIILWSLDIDNLQQLSCNWLHDYLANNSTLNEDERRICENMSR
ncbi:CHAT domain-containing protein [Plectonema cf. radiosum LEGE 06105]|uniref:CHAT domain-containing protein n=1 Tax=Plectonema cf. radiosum LEGE 06105 TaxID=945769 RepID=A0A8J7FF39_9CYAN|nr:CHAT domain-containing protein [Plectonema radiosum]MBE9213131.1 CHAT domain-containing protein [Plectonema cf. radiosum LEGE 06105]